MDINKAIRMAVDTGKVIFGTRESLRSALNGEGKLFIISDNCPKDIKADIEYYARLSNIKLLHFNGSNKDLSEACGKPYYVSVLTILEPGDSEILKVE